MQKWGIFFVKPQKTDPPFLLLKHQIFLDHKLPNARFPCMKKKRSHTQQQEKVAKTSTMKNAY
jgi:hypothetical protein